MGCAGSAKLDKEQAVRSETAMVNWIIRFMSVCFDRSASSRVVKGKTRLSSPPFRDKANQQSLWAGLQAGSLQVVATDHCAFSIETLAVNAALKV